VTGSSEATTFLRQRPHALHTAVWIIIASEALLFAGLFMLYTNYRVEYPVAFKLAAKRDIGWIGGVNTMVLLVSSFFVAWAVHRLRRAQNPRAALACVLVLGCTFLVLKITEWSIHISDGITPRSAGDLPTHGGQLFFALYYLMTGLHAAHVVAGLGLIAWATVLVGRMRITVAEPTILELVGVYWHFVDLVWVFLWPLFYLLP
jgi:cytochrome c oxidase subunit 3